MKWLVGVFAAVLVGLIARDTWGWLPQLSRAVIWVETLLLPRERRGIRREEWVGELVANFDDRRISGLIWTLRLAPIAVWERATFRGAARAGRSVRSSHETLLVWLLISAFVVVMVGTATVGLAAVRGNPLLPAALYSLAASALWVAGIALFEYPSRARVRRRERALRRVRTVQVLHDLNHEPAALSLREAQKLHGECVEVLARAGVEGSAGRD